MSSAMNSKAAPNVVQFLRNYKNAFSRLGAVDHSIFSQALEDNQRIGFEIKQYEDTLRAAKMSDFNPYKDSPEGYAGRLSAEQIDAFGNRMQ